MRVAIFGVVLQKIEFLQDYLTNIIHILKAYMCVQLTRHFVNLCNFGGLCEKGLENR